MSCSIPWFIGVWWYAWKEETLQSRLWCRGDRSRDWCTQIILLQPGLNSHEINAETIFHECRNKHNVNYFHGKQTKVAFFSKKMGSAPPRYKQCTPGCDSYSPPFSLLSISMTLSRRVVVVRPPVSSQFPPLSGSPPPPSTTPCSPCPRPAPLWLPLHRHESRVIFLFRLGSISITELIEVEMVLPRGFELAWGWVSSPSIFGMVGDEVLNGCGLTEVL